ncbi:MAG: FAD-dependent monooxygenase [Deltaproteobacteria bacterium]|nr:FAD-dependent monooxygenase [Deltaproteobacteria bacterium]
METCEVLVVGGGPAGSTCAGKLVQEGLDVLLLDKELFPREKPCAGWITPVLFEALELDAEEYRQGRVLQRQSGAVCRAAESPFRQRKFHHLFVTDILLNLILSRDQAALQRLVYAPYPS